MAVYPDSDLDPDLLVATTEIMGLIPGDCAFHFERGHDSGMYDQYRWQAIRFLEIAEQRGWRLVRAEE